MNDKFWSVFYSMADTYFEYRSMTDDPLAQIIAGAICENLNWLLRDRSNE